MSFMYTTLYFYFCMPCMLTTKNAVSVCYHILTPLVRWPSTPSPSTSSLGAILGSEIVCLKWGCQSQKISCPSCRAWMPHEYSIISKL